MRKRISAVIMAFALMLMCIPQLVLPAKAADTSGKCGDNVAWSFDNATRKLTIAGSGAIWEFENGSAPWEPIHESIKTVSITAVPFQSIPNIPNNAFAECSNLTSVTIPNGVKTIGDNAFWDCKRLLRIELPDSLTSIGNHAFYFCERLSNITIPQNVKEIGAGAFYTCGDLKRIVIPAGVTKLADSVFQYCYNLKRVKIPDSVTTIGAYTFAFCPNLRDVTIPNGVTSIGEGAFLDCGSLNSIRLPISIKTVSSFAFAKIDNPNAKGLREVYYSGTSSNWKNVSVDSDGNESLLNAAFHYRFVDSMDYYMSGTTNLGRPEIYNDDLALIAANLCNKTCDDGGTSDKSLCSYLTWDLGFEDENIVSKDYDSKLAFTIATRDYVLNDHENTKLMVIVARGSTVWEEFMDDVTSLPSEPIDGHYAYKVVDDFYRKIMKEFFAVWDPSVHYRVLLTGHSLGGAAVNLTAYNLTNLGILDDVYCYTFGAVNSIDDASTVSKGYENIHNIYNLYDTYSPKQFGSYLKTGMGTAVGKFGHLDLYSRDHRTEEEKMQDDMDQVFAPVNHLMPRYLQDVEDLFVASQMTNCGNSYDSKRISVIGCPVNVDVYCGEDLVGRVVNNEVDQSVTTLDIEIDDEVKYIRYPDNRLYTLKMHALNEATMTFLNSDMNDTGLTKLISNVSLYEGKEMYSEVGGKIKIPDIKLYTADNKGNAVAEILEDGTEIPIINPFSDIKKNAYYYDAVLWAVNHTPQITNGVDKSHFGPDNGCTRGQVVTFLWRAAGCPEPETNESSFTDVGAKAFYTKAVAWAVENKITNGMTETTFEPNATCTRGQIVTFLWRFQGEAEPRSTETVFTDVSESAFYAKAVAWAVENQVTNGLTAATFGPDATCTRGQVVTFLYRATAE